MNNKGTQLQCGSRFQLDFVCVMHNIRHTSTHAVKRGFASSEAFWRQQCGSRSILAVALALMSTPPAIVFRRSCNSADGAWAWAGAAVLGTSVPPLASVAGSQPCVWSDPFRKKGERERERQRDRERQTETDRETERVREGERLTETDRQRQTERQWDRERQRHRERGNDTVENQYPNLVETVYGLRGHVHMQSSSHRVWFWISLHENSHR